MEQDMLGIVVLTSYYIAIVVVSIALGLLPGFPKEMIRKTYHVLCSLSIFIILELFETWFVAAITVAVIFIISWAGTLTLRKVPWIKRMVFERIPRESQIPRQLLYMGLALSAILAVFWGVLGPAWKHHAAVGIMVWGVGDASAAIFGKKYGRRRLPYPIFDKDKSIEGTLAFILTSFPVLVITLNFLTGLSLTAILARSFVLAVAGGIVEALTKNGQDTLTIPLAVSLLSALMMFSSVL